MRFLVLAIGLVACKPDADPSSMPIEAYDPVALVDPFIATGGVGAQIANVNPGAARPFGMVIAGPDTRHEVYGAPGFYHCAGYHWEDTHISGFSHLHAHGIGITDYGNILVMPRATWSPAWTTDVGRMAPLDHEQETATPGAYAVTLGDDGTQVEIAATTRGAVHRYTFVPGAEPVIVFDLGHALGDDPVEASDIAIDLTSGEVTGFQNLHGDYSGRFGGIQSWFAATIDPAPIGGGTWTTPSTPQDGVLVADGREVGAWVRLPAGTTEATLRIGLSFVDVAGARGNRVAEVDGKTYETVASEAADAWRDEMGGVRVRGGTDRDQRVFHTALYHSMLMPSLHADVDGRYRGLDGEVHTADFDYYSNLSLWDTFRTLHPWYALARPDRQRDLAKSLVRMADDGGSLPRWPMAHGYTGGMIGTPQAQVLAETWLKGIEGWDVDRAFDYAYAQATGPVPQDARGGIGSYVDLGYVSLEASGGSASMTLEYAWSDDALGRLGRALGRDDEATVLETQAGSWRHHWDPAAGFMRGRHADGTFDPWAAGDEMAWKGEYTEGNAWHYVWYVPYDVDGMIETQHGGDRDAFIDRYAAYWEDVADEEDDHLPDDFYWHGNEPVMHYAFLGSLAGAPDRTAEAARWVLEHRYDDTPAGLDGNDDSGTLSAWYLFGAIGIFPIAGTPDYAVASPIFERVEIDRPDGTLVIRAPGASWEAPYVQAATLGEEPLTAAVIDHNDLIDAGELVLELGPTPGVWLP